MTILRDIFFVGMLFLVVSLFATEEQMNTFHDRTDYITDKIGQKADRIGDKFYRAFGRDFGIMLDNFSDSVEGLFATAKEDTNDLQKDRDRLVSKAKAAFNDFTILDCKTVKSNDC